MANYLVPSDIAVVHGYARPRTDILRKNAGKVARRFSFPDRVCKQRFFLLE